MNDVRNIGSYSPAFRQTETCPDEGKPKGPASDAPLNETTAATSSYDHIVSDVTQHLAQQILQGGSTASNNSSSTSNAPAPGTEKPNSQTSSDFLLSQGKLTLGDSVAKQATVQAGPMLTSQLAADDAPVQADDGPTKQTFQGGPKDPSPLGTPRGGSTGGTCDATFTNCSLSVVDGLKQAAAAYNTYVQSQQTQGGPPQSGPDGMDLLPTVGDRLPSAQGDLGDFPDTSGTDGTNGTDGSQDDPNACEDPGTPQDPNGPTGIAYNPDGDYGRGGLPGVVGPGVASFDPEAGGGGGVGSVTVPGFKDPRGGVGTPNPDGTGPIGPASFGLDKIAG